MSFLKDKTIKLSALALVLLAVILFFGLGDFPLKKSPVDNVVLNGDYSSCIVFDEKHCATGNKLEHMGITAMGFQFPDGINIYAPFDGQFVATVMQTGEVSGRIDKESEDGIASGISFSIIGEYELVVQPGVHVKKGQPIGISAGASVEGQTSDIIVLVQGIEPDGPAYNDPELLRQFFGGDN